MEVLATTSTPLAQRELESRTCYSFGTINRVMNELINLGYVENSTITDFSINVLEHYRANRIIFIAAGFGSLLVPITFNTLKPLVRVHGVRIIDRLIKACLLTGINEIYIV